jgi:hypothetical protein
MTGIWKLFASLALVASGIGGSAAQAGEVLVNGNLEMQSGPAGWTLTNTLSDTGAPAQGVTEHYAGADQTGSGLGLLLAGVAGNFGPYLGQNKAVNMFLTQTDALTSTAIGKTFTFTGNSFFQLGYSGNSDTLGELKAAGDYNQNYVADAADYTVWRDTLGQIGTGLAADGDTSGAVDQQDYDYWKAHFGNNGHAVGVPSPTKTFYKVEFLNASGTVLSTSTLDLTKNRTTEAWVKDTFTTPPAPVGTATARVTVAATNVVDNCSACSGDEQAYFDNFSLVQNGLFGGDKLKVVGDPPVSSGTLDVKGTPIGFEMVTAPAGLDNYQFTTQPWAHNPNTQGINALWVRTHAGGDVTMRQTVPATVGADYALSAWYATEPYYLGADPSTIGTLLTSMNVEFLDASKTVIATHTLDLRPFLINDDVWRQLTLDGGAAPTGSAFVRVSVAATGMPANSACCQALFWDDLSLIETLPGAGGHAGVVPEPSSLMLAGIAVALVGAVRRRGQ